MTKPEPSPERIAFTPVSLRGRHDGWLPDKQHAFIDALAETACVDEACAHVGMSRNSAYALRRRHDAQAFRLAWDAALDYAMRRLADAVIGRAVGGVEVPHYYRGELVGTHRRYDERLAMWLLRHRQPERFGKWMDRTDFERHPDGAALELAHRTLDVVLQAHKHLDEDEAPARTSERGRPERPGDAA